MTVATLTWPMQTFRREIESRTGTVHGIEDVEAQTPSLEDSYDDTDVLSSVIIQDTLGIGVPDHVFQQICVKAEHECTCR